MTSGPSVRISLLFQFASPALHEIVVSNLKRLEATEPVLGRGEAFTFSASCCTDRTQLLNALDASLARHANEYAIVVSDALVEAAADNSMRPADLALSIRKQLMGTARYCGLLAVVPGKQLRTSDVDHVLSWPPESADPDVLRRAITRVANGLRLKAPPGDRIVLGEQRAVRIEPVRSREQLAECFRLRHRVYGLMGYLDDEIAGSAAGIEMDCYDAQSLHLMAIEHRTGGVVGTARIVFPALSPFRSGRIFEHPRQQQSEYAAWCDEIAWQEDSAVLRRRLQVGAASMPIFQSFDMRERWGHLLTPVENYGELSRIIVSPDYRGAGVSRVMIRTAIATALDLKRPTLLLECAPMHAGMYRKYGFRVIGDEYYSRAHGLDQVAVAMRLELEPRHLQAEVAAADRILETLLETPRQRGLPHSSKVVCLCDHLMCWKSGAYTYRNGSGCPLRVR